MAELTDLLFRLTQVDTNDAKVQRVGSMLFGDDWTTVMDEIKEIDKTPQIVIIGKTGVGKSSTINKLFDPQPNLFIDHVEPATQNFQVLTLSLGKEGQTKNSGLSWFR